MLRDSFARLTRRAVAGQLKKSKNGAAPRWAAAAAPKPAGPPMNHPGVAAGALLPPPGLILDPPTANHGITGNTCVTQLGSGAIRKVFIASPVR